MLVEQPRDDKQQPHHGRPENLFPQRKVNQDQRAKWGDENQIADLSRVFGVLQRQLPQGIGNAHIEEADIDRAQQTGPDRH
ncbi:uncharacterized protein METZ01_LOCUS475725, partial [marine metagenome]